MMGVSELVGVEGSNRAISALSDDRDDSLPWSWTSVVEPREGVGEDGLLWELVGSSWASRGVSAGRSGSCMVSVWTMVACAFWSWSRRALLSSSQVSHFHCSRCVRP